MQKLLFCEKMYQTSLLKDLRAPNFIVTVFASVLFACLPLFAGVSKAQQVSVAKVESLLEREKYADVVRLGNSLVRGLDSNSEELRRTEYALGIALLKLGKLEEGRKYILLVSKLDSVDDLEKVARSVEAMNAWCEANVFLADGCKMTIAEARNNYEFAAKILRKRGTSALRTLAPPTLRAGYYLACAYVVRGDYRKASAVMRESGYWLSRGELLQQRNVLDNYLLSYGERKTDCHVFYAPWRGPESLNRGDIIRRSADLLMIRRDFVRA